MHATCRLFFWYWLFLHSEKYVLYQLNFISASSVTQLQDAKSIINDIPSVEKSTYFIKSVKPLTFLTPLEETCLLNQTGQSLEVYLKNPMKVTVATMSGGILGDDIYKFQKYRFYWQDYSINGTKNLESRVFYYNLKYGSFDAALNYKDGLVEVYFPIETNGYNPNPGYDNLAKIIQKEIKRPGDHTEVRSAFTYTWYVNFPYDSIYNYYSGSYYDENTGQTSDCTTTIELPTVKAENFISQEQFKSTFGTLVDCSGNILTNPSRRRTPDESEIRRQKGITVIELPL